MGFNWTPERRETLEALYLDGESLTDIAAAIGDGCNRNIVAGVVWRSGLERKFSKSPKAGWVNAPRKPRGIDQQPSPQQPAAPAPVPNAVIISLPHLSDSNCHYPIDGVGETVFCGDIARPGKPYCPYHYSLCYEKPRARPNQQQQSYLVRKFTNAERGGQSLGR